MKVKVIGKKAIHSKKNDRDYTVLIVTNPIKSEYGVGEEAETVWLNALNFLFNDFTIGSTYSIDRDGNGRVVDISKA